METDKIRTTQDPYEYLDHLQKVGEDKSLSPDEQLAAVGSVVYEESWEEALARDNWKEERRSTKR